ncbi:hypothetical protein ACWD0J_36510 [Streptomyces sp. NPDC003011]
MTLPPRRAGRAPGSELVRARAAIESRTTALWWSAGFFAVGTLITFLLSRRGVPRQDADAAPAVPG